MDFVFFGERLISILTELVWYDEDGSETRLNRYETNDGIILHMSTGLFFNLLFFMNE